MRSSDYTLVVLLLCSAAVYALPVLKSCEKGGRGGRWGLCAGVDPVTLRGSNYIRLGGPGLKGYHSTFDAGVYNRSRYIATFETMKRSGFNIARVFLDELPDRGIGGETNSTVPLDPAWVDRLAQFISDAEKRGIYTLVTMVYCPNNAYFRAIRDKIPQAPEWAPSWNQGFLTARGHAGYVAYGSALGAALHSRLTPAAEAAVLVSLQNEFFLKGNAYPFNKHDITLKMADGVDYNMHLPADRQQAADVNTNLWAERTRAAIRTALPNTLVTVGVFTFFAVQKAGPNGLILRGCGGSKDGSKDGSKAAAEDWSNGRPIFPNDLIQSRSKASSGVVDCRFPARPLWLSRSSLDFLDVHIYEKDGTPAALAKNIQTEEWQHINASKPILMGEFGCNDHWYASASACAPHVRRLQVSSCAQGFSGWLFWTYDTHPEQPDWYGMVDDGGAINDVLAPVRNPDPCKE